MKKTFFIVISLSIGLILGTLVLMADINTGLVSYWPFNDNLDDVTGNGYDGQMINGTVSYIQGVKGKGIKLPGTTDSRIFLNPWIPGNSSLTISGWVKMLNQDEFWYGYQGPIYVSQDWDYSHGFYIRPIMRQGELHIEFGIEASTGTGNMVFYVLYPIEFYGKWHHLAGVVDRGKHEIRLYYDGVLVATSPLTTGAVYPTKGFIGSYDYITARDGHTRFVSPTHRLDEIRLYNRALTYEEIQELFFDVSTTPTVTTNLVSSITSNSAVCGGNVTSDGGATVTARGVCWNTSSNPTTGNSKTIDGSGTGSFTSNIIGLNPGTTYYVRAYATNSKGTSYGSNVSFNTNPTSTTTPTVTTNSVSSITFKSAVCGGNVISDGGSTVTARGVCWSTTSNPVTNDSRTTDGSGTGSFTSNITGLKQGTTYYVRAYATNSIGTSYGANVSFTTEKHGKPIILLTPGRLNFSAIENTTTGFQTIYVNNSGTGELNWLAQSNSDWLNITPLSGLNSGTITVTVNPFGLQPGTYTSTITITDSNAINSPQSVSVNFNVHRAGQTTSPFGEFATPIDGSTISSSIAVTGWVLDDIGVESVKIYRNHGKDKVYIGDAVFVEGARPDVAQAYPTYPNNYKAGWGYMLLTNFLPNNGNGTFTLHAIATDIEGNQVTLGTKTILVDNANAVKPFGAIDTPTQGGTASGSNYRNWGWVLTPQPNMIPTNGSTINVWVDGVKLGHPAYNIYRSDIASLFPGYANSNGAAGYFDIDTTAYNNGVHTIQWTATDNGGNTDGIGSRYFTIQNTGSSQSSSAARRNTFTLGYRDLNDIPISYAEPVKFRKGYTDDYWSEDLYPDNDGITHIQCKELERIDIRISQAEIEVEGDLKVGNRLMSLPVGSTLEKMGGRFHWIPGPGFVGTYSLVFIETNKYGEKSRKHILVNIDPKFSRE